MNAENKLYKIQGNFTRIILVELRKIIETNRFGVYIWEKKEKKAP